MKALAKYIQISDIIRSQIRSNKLENGYQLAPVKKLAEQYGTTKTTICKALGILQRERLISCRQGFGTFVNNTPNISIAIVSDCLIFDEGISSYLLQVLREIYVRCQEKGFNYKQYFNVDSTETAQEFLHDVENGVFNYAIVNSRWVAENCVNILSQKYIKCIGIYDYPELQYFSNTDYIGAISASVKYFANQGCKRIGIIRGFGKRDFETLKNFTEKIIGIFRKNGLLFDPKLYIESPLTMHDGEQAFRKLWKESPEAIIITDALLTLGAARTIYEQRIKITEELSIISHNTKNNSVIFPASIISYTFSVEKQIETIFDMISDFHENKIPKICKYSCPFEFNPPLKRNRAR